VKDNINQSRILSDFSELAFHKNIPMHTTLEITHGCNFSCKHCYNFDRTQKKSFYDESEILSKDEILNAIDQVCEAGGMFINLSGGEPLTSPYIYDYIKRVKFNNSMARLKTNFSLINPERASLLYHAGIDQVEGSIYGIDEKTYEIFTSKKNFKNSIDGILELKKFNIDITANIIIHKYNYKDLDKMITLLTSLDVGYEFSDEITSRYDKSDSSCDMQINDQEFEELLLGSRGEAFWYNNKEKSLQCSCAKNVCAIALNGDVYPCIGAPIKAGNIKEDNFKKIWEESDLFNEIRGIKSANFKECMKCDYIENCSRSSGTTYINTGDYYGCDEQTLSQAKIRNKHKSKFKNAK